MARIFFSICLIFFAFTSVNAQKDVRVNSFEIQDYLSIDDLIDPDYGRYDAYEIHLNKGDYFSIILNSNDFWPVFYLSTPSGENIFQYPKKGSNRIDFDTTCKESGTWNLYVICDTSEVGKYDCKVSFATKDAIVKQNTTNFCKFTKSIIEHANADFIFLKKAPSTTGIILKGNSSPKILKNSNANYYLSVLYLDKNLTTVMSRLKYFSNQIVKCGLTIEKSKNPFNKFGFLKSSLETKSFIVYSGENPKEIILSIQPLKKGYALNYLVTEL